MGAFTVRAVPDTARSNHRQHGDRGIPSQSTQRIDVPHLPGHVEKDNDNEGMPAPVLFGVHNHCFTIGEQGMSDVSEKISIEAFLEARSKLRPSHFKDLSQQR